MHRYRFYLFDMGSTLLEFHNPEWDESVIVRNGHSRMINAIAQKYGGTVADIIDESVILPWYEYIEHDRHKQLREYRICEALFLKFNQLKISISYSEILHLLKLDYLDFYEYAHPNEGVIDSLTVLKARGCKIGVVSNIMYPPEMYREIFTREKLDPYIDCYSFSYENTSMKPHASLFVRALMAMNADISETLMAGDSETSDIIGAQTVGLATCLYDPYMRFPSTTADFAIRHFQELTDC